MESCHVCHEDLRTPFECNYCGETYCSTHRLPESHECPHKGELRPPAKSNTRGVVEKMQKDTSDDSGLLSKLKFW